MSNQPQDDNQGPTDSNNSQLAELTAKIEQLETDLAAANNAKLLTMADFQNFRKNMEAEKSKYGVLTNMQLVMHELEVIDDIQMALQDKEITVERAQEMLQIASDKLTSSLSVAGLEKVEIKVGDKYDPKVMEAVTTVPVTDAAQNNSIVAVISAAYRYAGQSELIKTAKVVVGKAKN